MTTISPDEFRLGMRQLVASVCVITTAHEGRRAGLTATAVCSLSADPPRLLVSVNRRGYSFGLIQQSRSFCVNVLAAGQDAISACFASPAQGDAEDRFAASQWDQLATGAPALREAVAAFDCRVASILDVGSHGIIIGEIAACRTTPDQRALLYADGAYASLPVRAGAMTS